MKLPFYLLILLFLSAININGQNLAPKYQKDKKLLNLLFLTSYPPNKSFDEYLVNIGYNFMGSKNEEVEGKSFDVLTYKNKVEKNSYIINLYKSKILYVIYTLSDKSEFEEMLSSVKGSNLKYQYIDTKTPNIIRTVYSNKDFSVIFNKEFFKKKVIYSAQASNNFRTFNQ